MRSKEEIQELIKEYKLVIIGNKFYYDENDEFAKKIANKSLVDVRRLEKLGKEMDQNYVMMEYTIENMCESPSLGPKFAARYIEDENGNILKESLVI